MAAHTPGPWVAEPTPQDQNPDPEFDLTDAPFWIADVNGMGEVLALVNVTVNDDEAFANACLIAKAPELLASCKELRAVLVHALDVIALAVGIDLRDRIAEDLAQRGFAPGIIGVRADGVIAEAEGRPTPQAMTMDPEPIEIKDDEDLSRGRQRDGSTDNPTAARNEVE